MKPTLYIITEPVSPLPDKLKELSLRGTQRSGYSQASLSTREGERSKNVWKLGCLESPSVEALPKVGALLSCIVQR